MAKGFCYIAVTPDEDERVICRGNTVSELAQKLGITEHVIRARLHGTAINSLDRLYRAAPRYRDAVRWFIREVELTNAEPEPDPAPVLMPEPEPQEQSPEPPKPAPIKAAVQVVRELQPFSKYFQIGYEFQICSSCRTRVSSGDTYCRGCGRPLIKAVPLE